MNFSEISEKKKKKKKKKNVTYDDIKSDSKTKHSLQAVNF